MVDSSIKVTDDQQGAKEKVIYHTDTPKAVKKVIKDTVGLLPVEELRQLLRG